MGGPCNSSFSLSLSCMFSHIQVLHIWGLGKKHLVPHHLWYILVLQDRERGLTNKKTEYMLTLVHLEP